MSGRGKAMDPLRECECCFTPGHFLELLELQRRWIEWLIIAMLARTERRAINTKTLADDAISLVLKLRTRQLRN